MPTDLSHTNSSISQSTSFTKQPASSTLKSTYISNFYATQARKPQLTAAFKIMLIGGRQIVWGVRSPSGQHPPVLRSYMDVSTTLLRTCACGRGWISSQPNLWASQCGKGTRDDNISSYVNREKIRMLVEQSGWSLGRLYTADLSDKQWLPLSWCSLKVWGQ